jgi:hypothetical protein
MKKVFFSIMTVMAMSGVAKATESVEVLPKSNLTTDLTEVTDEDFFGTCVGTFSFYPNGSYGNGGRLLYTITVTVTTNSEQECFDWSGGATLSMADDSGLDVVGMGVYYR